MFRAYAKYLRQTGFTFSQDYMEETLAAFPAMSRALSDLFRIRFDPKTEHREKAEKALLAEIETLLEAVENLDQDRILHAFLNLIQSTLRTNFYQKGRDGTWKTYISMKLDSRTILDLPAPPPRWSKSGSTAQRWRAFTCLEVGKWPVAACDGLIMGGLPQRNPRPHESPNGQKRRHCPGWI